MSELEALAKVGAQSGDPANPSPEELRDILRASWTIAVVGLSRDPAKAARRVPSYLSTKGFSIIPVNPHGGYILGQPVRKTLAEVTEPVDIVLLFRPSEEVGALIEEAARRPDHPVTWLQEGIRDDEAAAAARRAGRTVIQDLCIFKAHRAWAEQRYPPFG
jgi:uncharacterized protein